MNNPYWSQMMPSIMPVAPAMVPQILPQPLQQTQPQQVTPQSPQQPVNPVPTTWTWKAVQDYQSMLKEAVPFDGTPVLFMLQNESVFYVVTMENGRKMVNGYSFHPLDKTNFDQETPEEKRFSKLEASVALIVDQLNRLAGVSNESNIENIESVQRTSIKEQ